MGLGQQLSASGIGGTDLKGLSGRNPVEFKTGPRITGRMTCVGAILLSAVALGSALIGQFVYGLQPCELCIAQRWPWIVAIGLSLIVVTLVRNKFIQSILILATGITLLTNSGIAFFHVGVEQAWWAGLASCSPALPTGASIEELRAHLLAAPTVSCGDVAWSLFGISMAGYNALLSLAGGLALIVQAWFVQREPADAE